MYAVGWCKGITLEGGNSAGLNDSTQRDWTDHHGRGVTLNSSSQFRHIEKRQLQADFSKYFECQFEVGAPSRIVVVGLQASGVVGTEAGIDPKLQGSSTLRRLLRIKASPLSP